MHEYWKTQIINFDQKLNELKQINMKNNRSVLDNVRWNRERSKHCLDF